MAGSAKQFGLKFKEALDTVKAKTGRSLADIKDDIGDFIGYKAATINQIQRGRLLPKLKKLELLTRVLVDPRTLDSETLLVPTGFDRAWFEQFLQYGDYPTKARERLIEELFPYQPSNASMPMPDVRPMQPELPPSVSVVGRDKELLALQRQLEVGHVALITGMPGIGKTTLAGALIQLLDPPPDRLFWYTLRGRDGLDSIIYQLANFLAYHDEPAFLQLLSQGRQLNTMLLDQILLTMSGKGYVLCLDDFHRQGDTEIVNQILTPLLQGAKQGDFTLLIVSREAPPGIYGIDMKSFTVEGLNEKAVTQLLSQLNQSTSDDMNTVLHRLTQGNPQFLILAATILNQQQNLDNLLNRIGEEIDIERFMLAEVDENLDDDEQDVMRSISICMDYPATYPLIEEIADQGNLRKALNHLCHRHLLLVYKDWDATRYSQHAIVQQFYYGQIRRKERQAMHARAAAYYSLEEQDAFKAALHYEKAGEFEQAAAQLIDENTLSLIYQGRALEAGNLLEKLISKFPENLELQNRIHLARGAYLRIQGRYSEAISAFTTVKQRVESAEEQVNFLSEIARTYRRQSAFDQALETFQQVMDIYRHNPALPVDPKILNGLGWTYDSLGNLEQANRYFQEVWNNHRDSLTTDIAANTLLGIGSIEWQTGNIDAAEQHFLESRRLFEQTNDLIGKTQSTNNLGIVYFKQDRLDEAFDCWDEALEISRSIGAMNELLVGYNNVASAHILNGQYSHAIRYLSDALPLAKRSQNRQMLSRIYGGLAEAELGRNQLSQAANYLSQASQWAADGNYEAERGIIAYLSAALALAEDNHEQALQFVEDAIPLLEKTHQSDYLVLSQSLQKQILQN